ncbi:hypothetical protein [Chitinophaga sp. YIM B06452]|uniref:hypothetical protein n=1 Tax=Chitinophaga sp. YIM B06452 TaxID=3082158 RepID=UPI0031FF1F0F
MAKQKNLPDVPATQVVIQEPQRLSPAAVVPAEDPAKNELAYIKLNFGEVLVCPLDANGNEGLPFKVSHSTYVAFYSNPEKFTLKKTS